MERRDPGRGLADAARSVNGTSKDADSEKSWFGPRAPAEPRFRGGGRLLSRGVIQRARRGPGRGIFRRVHPTQWPPGSGAPRGACRRAQGAALLACWHRLLPAPLRERRGLALPQTKRSTSCARSLRLRLPRKEAGPAKTRDRAESPDRRTGGHRRDGKNALSAVAGLHLRRRQNHVNSTKAQNCSPFMTGTP
jgi:hypothetical protein